MNKARRNNAFLFVLLFAVVPGLVFAQTDTTDTSGSGSGSGTSPTTIAVPQGFSGILSCNQNGAYSMSVGSLGATGGVYVPVADAAVELNTGTLVYKECVLREVIVAERQVATAGYTQQATNYVLTGRTTSQGTQSALFVQQQTQEMAQVGTQAMQNFLQNGLNSLDPATKTQVQQAIAQAYSNATYNSTASLACPYPGATSDFTSANPSGNIWNDILAVASPCNPLFGYIEASDLANGYVAEEQNCLQNEWQWGGGFYAVTTGSGGPCEQQIVTPSSEVNGLYSQVLQSPYNQLQSANDLGQMVGALFAGIGTQVLSGTGGGITGLNQSVGGQPSYLQQAVTQESQNLQSSVSNAALTNLESALQIEQDYYNIMSQIAGTLEGAISQLRGSENQCWVQVVKAVCAGGTVNSDGTCTATVQCDPTTGQNCPTGQKLKVATSTEFSQAVITSQIAPLASTTASNLQISQQALNLINQLIQNVTGTSPDSQALAIQQLNTLIANNELHTPNELTTAQSQAQSVQTAMQNLEQNTPSLWAGTDPLNTDNNNIPWNGSIGPTIQSTDPGVGWCNFQNATTISAWENKWKS